MFWHTPANRASHGSSNPLCISVQVSIRKQALNQCGEPKLEFFFQCQTISKSLRVIEQLNGLEGLAAKKEEKGRLNGCVSVR